ncbi:hypothetical protein OKW43_008606 [Paraburkholderia sp. WC7.3g]
MKQPQNRGVTAERPGRFGDFQVADLLLIAALSGVVLLSACASKNARVANTGTPFTIDNGCDTSATDVMGERSSCSFQTCKSFGGDFIAQYTVQRRFGSGSTGDEERCDIEFRSYHQAVDSTGISDPLVVCVTASVKSPGGVPNMGQKGHIRCSTTGNSYPPVLSVIQGTQPSR